MPAKTKSDLLKISRTEFAKLQRLIAPLEDELALRKDPDDTSIKDVIAHRAHWIDLFLGWYHDGQAGRPVFFPAEGYKWNDLKRYNADLRARQSDLGWQAAQTALSDSTARLLHFLQEATEDMLYGQPMKGAKNHWTTGRWAEAAGPSHFRSAAKYIRARMKADA